ncbi:proton channel OTOP1 [Sapajus apella]|uniref:Proton channel OTOP1 n=1 Tax=Sapajus apella TaxID=9515 RepID=A0A6J3FWY7_SAPAP|nr:proton channel OTOP1 [Sapajus apella]
MLEGLGSPASPRAAASASVEGSLGPAACPPSSPSSPRSMESPATRRGGVRASVPQKLAEALSSQYGLNVFVAGLLLLLAWAVHAAGVGKSDLLCLLTALMLLQLLWMLWYVGRSSAHRRLFRLKDTHAGAGWLRGSITLFAVITIILGCLKIGYFIGFSECLPATEGVFPVTHAVHTLLQVYFLWGHAKDIIQSFKTLERFGVIHSVFTNLLLWANGVLNESKHQLNEHKERLITLGFGNITTVLDDHTPQCNCTPPTLCTAISHGIYYLYPFNIEYQILASTMLYVLWKNIGRKVDSHQHQKMQFKSDGVVVGAALGLTALAATIGVVVVYLIHIGRSKTKSESALIMFYLYAITLLMLMGAAGLAGIRIYRMDEKSLDESKNPARKLDSDLLVGTASGSWLISWGSILAILCAELWIPPAFGCRPEYDNGLEEIVFGFEPWIIVVNLAMPFSIFYRMHAAASLFEVYYCASCGLELPVTPDECKQVRSKSERWLESVLGSLSCCSKPLPTAGFSAQNASPAMRARDLQGAPAPFPLRLSPHFRASLRGGTWPGTRWRFKPGCEKEACKHIPSLRCARTLLARGSVSPPLQSLVGGFCPPPRTRESQQPVTAFCRRRKWSSTFLTAARAACKRLAGISGASVLDDHSEPSIFDIRGKPTTPLLEMGMEVGTCCRCRPARCELQRTALAVSGHQRLPVPSAETGGTHRGHRARGASGGERSPRAPRGPAQLTVSAPQGSRVPWLRGRILGVPDGAARGSQG